MPKQRPASAQALAPVHAVFSDGSFLNASFDDDVWRAAGTNDDEYRLKWGSIVLKDGSILTDRKRSKLLLAAKTLLALIAAGTAARKKRPRGGSLHKHFTEIKRLLIWMSGRGLFSFREITTAHVVGYRNFIRNRKTAGRGHMSKGRKPKAGTKSASKSAQVGSLNLLLYLVRLQSEMGELGVDLNLHEVEDLLGSRAAVSESATPRIPDHIFIQTINAAIQVIDQLGSSVAAIQSEYRRWLAESARQSATGNRRRFSNFTARKDARPVLVKYRGEDVDLMTLSHYDIREMMVALRGACFVIVASLVGMRMCEIRSLRRGCLIGESLHDGRRLLRLHGTLFKTSRQSKGEPAAWVAGWEDAQNPILKAISVLEALADGSPLLFGRTRGDRDRILSPSAVCHFIKGFLDVAGVDVDWQFSSHQFRKTFARFVALSGSSAALALMRHFKHVSIQMTERYFPNDPELINEIIEASEELIAESLTRVFGSERLGGMRGREIVSRNQGYRGEQNAKELAELVKMTMLDPSVYVVLHVYGVCLYERSTAKCGGNIAQVGLTTCVGCVNFAVGQEHIPFWSEQVKRLGANIALQAENGIVNLELQRQLDEAKRMLSQMEAA